MCKILFAKAKEGGVSNKGRFAAFMGNCIDLHKNPCESLGVGGRREITREIKIFNLLHNWRLIQFLSSSEPKTSWFLDDYWFTPKVLKVHHFSLKFGIYAFTQLRYLTRNNAGWILFLMSLIKTLRHISFTKSWRN